MPRLRRTSAVPDVPAQPAAEPAVEPAAAMPAATPATPPTELERLRDEPDPDPLVEEAAQRLRQALISLEAHDEWGRLLAWRKVAQIALGPIVLRLRDAQTAARLMAAATQPAPEPLETRDVVMDVIQSMLHELHVAQEDVVPAVAADDGVAPSEERGAIPDDMPFWPA